MTSEIYPVIFFCDFAPFFCINLDQSVFPYSWRPLSTFDSWHLPAVMFVIWKVKFYQWFLFCDFALFFCINLDLALSYFSLWLTPYVNFQMLCLSDETWNLSCDFFQWFFLILLWIFGLLWNIFRISPFHLNPILHTWIKGSCHTWKVFQPYRFSYRYSK